MKFKLHHKITNQIVELIAIDLKSALEKLQWERSDTYVEQVSNDSNLIKNYSMPKKISCL